MLDYLSPMWTCFYEFLFAIGLSFPFPPFISEVFETIGFSYAQVILVVRCILFWIHHLNEYEGKYLGLLRLQVFITFIPLGIVSLFSRFKLKNPILFWKLPHMNMIGRSGTSLLIFLPLARISLHPNTGCQKVDVLCLVFFTLWFIFNVDSFFISLDSAKI